MVDKVVPLAFACTLGILLIWGRAAPVVITDSHVSPEVSAGGWVTISHEMNWRRWDCVDMSISASFVDSINSLHPKELFDLGAPNYSQESTYDWQIPFQGMSLGKARTKSVMSFACAPFYWIWPVKVQLPELRFNVVK